MSITQPKNHLLIELGRGGMGTVYLAVARGPGGFSKLKVVKRLRPDLAHDEHFLAMFLDEARLAARLYHPNVVQTNEVGFDGAHYFIEMEYLDGQAYDALQRRAAKTGGVPFDIALNVLTQALSGLHYAHELRDHSGNPLRIVHRDVSPHNLLVTHDGGVKLLDFGIAKAADSSTDTTTGVVKGKARYMAPEQAARGAVDRRADVFAIGVILWETLTRRRMWAGESDFEIFLALRRGPPPAPRSIDESVPDSLNAICVKALAFRAEDRFATAGELQSALEEEAMKRGGGIGAKALAAYLDDHFGEARRATRAAIDQRLRELDTPQGANAPTSVDDVPILDPSVGILESVGGSTAKNAQTSETNDSTRAAVPSARRLSVESKNEPASLVDQARTKSAVISGIPERTVRRARGPRTLTILGALLLAASVGVYARSRLGRPAPSPLLAAAVGDASSTRHDCSHNSDCLAFGSSARCVPRTHECVALESNLCKVHAPPAALTDDGTLWLGAMMPLTGERAGEYGTADSNVLLLAEKDFALFASAGGRPIGTIMCDNAQDPQAAADHLVKVGVPAVLLGAPSGEEAVSMTTRTFQPEGILVLSVEASNRVLGGLGKPESGPRMVWLAGVTSDQFGAALAEIAGDLLDPLSRQYGHLPPSASVRVALIRGSGPFSFGLANTFVSTLHINGEDAVSAAASFKQIVMEAGNDGGSADRAVVDALLAFKPNVITVANSFDFYARILKPLEEHWPANVPRPLYASNGLLTSPEVYSFVGTSAERRHRFFAVELPANTQPNLQFVLRYNEFYSPPITLGTAPGTLYDAFYMAALAGSMGDPKTPPTSRDVAAGISRFTADGELIEVGPSHLEEALRLLRSGRNIDLHGAGFRVALDPSTGEVSSDFAVYCLALSDDGRPNDMVESGLTVDIRQRRLLGKMHCH